MVKLSENMRRGVIALAEGRGATVKARTLDALVRRTLATVDSAYNYTITDHGRTMAAVLRDMGHEGN